MDADENDITNYLKVLRGQYVSAREIARKAAGKRRYDKEPGWAVPVLMRLLDKRVVDGDAMGHYRLTPESEKKKPKRWVSPEMQAILEKTGKDFSRGVEIDQPETPPPGTGPAPGGD